MLLENSLIELVRLHDTRRAFIGRFVSGDFVVEGVLSHGQFCSTVGGFCRGEFLSRSRRTKVDASITTLSDKYIVTVIKSNSYDAVIKCRVSF